MWILIVSLVLLGIVSWLATRLNWLKSSETTTKTPEQSESVCCGAHEICEKDTLLAFESKAVYYDDEELDTYRKTPARDYQSTDIDLFKSIFYTMKPEDVAGWLRSLQIREIELPEALKEEALLIVSERRLEAQ